MSWQSALILSILFSASLVTGGLLYCDIKSKEFDEDEDE